MARKKTSDVEGFIAGLEPPVKDLMKELRTLVRKAAPKLSEALKWGQPVYSGEKNLMYLGKAKAHASLGFFMGAKMSDPDDLLEGSGNTLRHVTIRSKKDINKRKLSALIRQAVRLDA